MRRARQFLVGCGLLLAASGGVWANKALDILESDARAGKGGFPVPEYEETRETVSADPKVIVEVDLSLPRHWDTELEPLFPVEPLGGPGLSAFALRGLYEWRYERGEIDGAAGGDVEMDSSRVRRARLGMALRTFYNTELEGQALFDGGGSYRGIETLKVRVPLSEAVALTVGKFQVPFTLENTQDAAVRWTPELSPLVAQMAPANSLGVMLGGRGGDLEWKVGWFSGDAARGIPDLGGGGFLLAGLAYHINGVVPHGDGSASSSYNRLHLDYLYNFEGAESESIPMAYRHLVSAGFQSSSGRVDVMGDFLLASGDESTAFGLALSGSYWLMEDALRLVGRYNFSSSDDPGGVLSGWGIPNAGSDGLQALSYPVESSGEWLNSIYVGLNVHLYQDNLILSTGLDFRNLKEVVGGDEIDSWTWLTGGRMAF